MQVFNTISIKKLKFSTQWLGLKHTYLIFLYKNKWYKKTNCYCLL